MPAPLDISIWHSVWTVEKKKIDSTQNSQWVQFDFNVGYITTTVLAVGFLSLGALVMYGTGESFSNTGGEFANQLIQMYTYSLGEETKLIIAIAALTTMFSTTLTTLDASPRVMQQSVGLLRNKIQTKGYYFWLSVLVIGTLSIFFFFISEMGMLIKIATILSFLTAPFYAIVNYILITGKNTPAASRPSLFLRIYSLLSILILIVFSLWYLSTL